MYPTTKTIRFMQTFTIKDMNINSSKYLGSSGRLKCMGKSNSTMRAERAEVAMNASPTKSHRSRMFQPDRNFL